MDEMKLRRRRGQWKEQGIWWAWGILVVLESETRKQCPNLDT